MSIDHKAYEGKSQEAAGREVEVCTSPFDGILTKERGERIDYQSSHTVQNVSL